MTKKKVIALLSVFLLMVVAVGGTLAYYTDIARARNVITTGGINIELVEKAKVGDTEVDFDEANHSGLMPGMTASKIVSVKNVSENTAWIRVKVETKITSAEGVLLPRRIPGKEGTEVTLIATDNDTETWIYDEKTGYYYYPQALASEESTEPLFRNVSIAPEMGNAYQNCKIEVIVSAEAVQEKNNPIPEGGNVTDIPGWPKAEEVVEPSADRSEPDELFEGAQSE